MCIHAVIILSMAKGKVKTNEAIHYLMLWYELVASVSKSKTEAEKEAIMINNELIANIQDQYDSSTCFTDMCLTMKRTYVCMALRIYHVVLFFHFPLLLFPFFNLSAVIFFEVTVLL